MPKTECTNASTEAKEDIQNAGFHAQTECINASTEAKEDRPCLSTKILDSLVVCSYSETLGTRIILVETPPNWII